MLLIFYIFLAKDEISFHFFLNGGKIGIKDVYVKFSCKI